MISLIFCSKSIGKYDDFKRIALENLGVPGEIIDVDNSSGIYSIAKAYNKGANNSNFEFLVFVHEDVFFHTANWGQILIHWFNTLKNPGVMGIAGSSYSPISPSDWWLSNKKYLHVNFLSNHKNGSSGEGVHEQSGNLKPISVFALDGMFLAMKKSVWKEFPFDESLEGFHGYDTSICLRVSQKYINYFVPGILIEHFSKGYPNKSWLINTIQAKESIQIFIDSINRGQILDKNLELEAYHLFLNQLKKFSDSWFFSFRYSFIYLIRLNSSFLSYKSCFLWFVYQVAFLAKPFKK